MKQLPHESEFLTEAGYRLAVAELQAKMDFQAKCIDWACSVVIFGLILALVLSLTACQSHFLGFYAPPTLERVEIAPNQSKALQMALKWLGKHPGDKLETLYNTGSMRPLMQYDGYLAIRPVPYDSVTNGMIICSTSWTGGRYVHEVVGKDSGGLITAGTGPQNYRSDNWILDPQTGFFWRVTPQRYHGQVVAYFGYPPPIVHSLPNQ